MKKFKIMGKEIEYNGKKFNAYKTKLNGEWIDVKFTRNCKNRPEEATKYFLEVEESDMNISSKGFYKVLWIKNCTKTEKIERKYEFNFDEDLPF